MHTIAYIAMTAYGPKLFMVTTPSRETALDLAMCLRQAPLAKNVRVWSGGEIVG